MQHNANARVVDVRFSVVPSVESRVSEGRGHVSEGSAGRQRTGVPRRARPPQVRQTSWTLNSVCFFLEEK